MAYVDTFCVIYIASITVTILISEKKNNKPLTTIIQIDVHIISFYVYNKKLILIWLIIQRQNKIKYWLTSNDEPFASESLIVDKCSILFSVP